MALSEYQSAVQVLDDIEVSPQCFAHGGESDIFLGWPTLSSGKGILVAVKMFRGNRNDKTAVEVTRQRVLQESDLLSRLDHPFIVTFYGITYQRGYPGLVMPYYSNGNAIDYLQHNPQASVLELACEVAAGLEYLHNLSHPLIHGDVKATNILVDDENHARLTDFSLTRVSNISGENVGRVGGSCRWTPPEMFNGYATSTFSDVWAFGMTVLQMFTKKVPFENILSNAHVAMNVARGYLPQQPPEVNDIGWATLKRCWTLEPTRRPAISTVSIILTLTAAQKVVSPARVDEVVDYLEHRKEVFGDREIGWRPRKLAFPKIILRSPSYPSVDSNHSQQKASRLNADSPDNSRVPAHSEFQCRWPGCNAKFMAHSPRTRHWVQHRLPPEYHDEVNQERR